MKTTILKKAITLSLMLAFISVMGFAQNDDRKELAEKASLSLTKSMTSNLKLTDIQKDAIAQCNLSYALVLFTTTPLTNDVAKTFETDLNTCLRKVLDDNQYKTWELNKQSWLDSVKKQLPKEKEQSENESKKILELDNEEDIL